MIIDTSTTHGKILVMQAHMEGAELQCRKAGGFPVWECADAVVWDWLRYDYRIKPVPREWWANIYGSCAVMHETKESADSRADNGRTDCIRVREVLED